MADWRQIQARIRKAKNAPDAHVKLSDLYARTHDAMVAWELATIEEKAERTSEAVKWYTLSAERFRRPEWKKKAEEALLRLGAPLPPSQAQIDPPVMKPGVEENTEAFHIPAASVKSAEDEPLAADDHESDEQGKAESEGAEPIAASGAAGADESDGLRKKRRRGRRGGRGRRKKVGAVETARPSQAVSEASGPAAPVQVRPMPTAIPPVAPIERSVVVPVERANRTFASSTEGSGPTAAKTLEMPIRPPAIERSAQGRAGDPALASRMAQLESMLRRLVASTAHRLDEIDEAPAGPGVFLLSDSDQVTSYYVESCQTLRVAVGNVARGGRGSKNPRGGRNFGDEDLKAKFAEHLGISESKVAQYMKDHCVIRWIQLDEDAAHLAHFAIGVLRTPLNVI